MTEKENERKREREIERGMEENATKEEEKPSEVAVEKDTEEERAATTPKWKNKRKRISNEESADKGERNEDREEKEKIEGSLSRWHYDRIRYIIKYNKEKEVEKKMLTFTKMN